MKGGPDQYLIISADGSRTSLAYMGRDGLLQHLAEAGEYAEGSGNEPRFLELIPFGDYGVIDPGMWVEGCELILKVEVVVPQPITTKWSI